VIAPLAAITYIYRTRQFLKWPHHPLWILVLGGAGIVTGLAIWGKVIATIGKHYSPQPSGGFCARLALRIVFPAGLTCLHPLISVGGVVGWSGPKYQVNSIQNRWEFGHG